MKKIALINMPFTNLGLPSIALTQLKCKLEKVFGKDISVEIFYFSLDFAEYLGIDTYWKIAGSINSLNSGIGEWFFRQAAFPDLANNKKEYYQRYFPRKTDDDKNYMAVLDSKRSGVDDFIEHLIDKHQLDTFDVVGFTSMFAQNVASFSMARHIKARNSSIITVMGGANCEAPMGQEIAINVESIDYVFSGPSLKTFPEFIRYCMDGEISKCKHIDGVFYKANAQLLRGQQVLGEEQDINDVMELDYDAFIDLIDDKFPNSDIEISLPFETSRGCWWGERAHCTFCGLNGLTMKYRAMKSEKAINQISSLFKYSARVNRLECVDNIIPKEYITDVFPYLNTPDNMHIFYEIRADLSGEEMQVLSDARVKTVQPGIESLATSTLKHMKKGSTSFNNIEFLKNCVLHDVYPGWNLLIGFPGEKAEVYKKYLSELPKLTHFPPPAGTYPVRYDRFSPYFNKAEEYGLDLHPLPFYSITYPFSESSLNNMAYFFADHNYASDYVQALVQHIIPLQEVVATWKQRWFNGGEQPMLYLYSQGSEYNVFDSRTEEAKTYQITALAARVLDALSRRKSINELFSALDTQDSSNINREVESLLDKGLIFEENGKLMNLVLPRKTSGFSMKLN